MSTAEIKAKAATLAALYTAKGNGKMLQMLQDGKWIDLTPGAWTGNTLSYGPNFASDLSRWRVKPEPRRMWTYESRSGSTGRTSDERLVVNWKAEGYTVTEWQEVLP